MESLSAALGYEDTPDDTHFLLDEETVHYRLFHTDAEHIDGEQSSLHENHKLRKNGTPTFN
eukprot:13233665-Heterocapsa_arctica.AAC.1